MTPAQLFAIQHYLSEYPDNKTFDEILDLIAEGHDSVLIWEPFEHYDLETVTDYISHMASDIESKFYPLKDAACIIERGAVKEMLDDYIGRTCNENELDKVCEFIENDFVYQVCEKVSDAVTYSNIECSPLEEKETI